MRTTIDLDDDTASAVKQLRDERHIGVSEAVNSLIRTALLPRTGDKPYKQRTSRLGLKVDISSVSEALEVLEGDQAK